MQVQIEKRYYTPEEYCQLEEQQVFHFWAIERINAFSAWGKLAACRSVISLNSLIIRLRASFLVFREPIYQEPYCKRQR